MTSTRHGFALGSFSMEASEPFLGAVVDGSIVRVDELVPGLGGPTPTLLSLLHDWSGSFVALSDALAEHGSVPGGVPLIAAGLRAHAPLPDARQVFCTGANYGRHVVEMVLALGDSPRTDGMNQDEMRQYGEAYVMRQRAESRPYIFMKPSTAIAGPDDELVLPAHSSKMDWELELGAVIGTVAYQLSREQAMSCVAGYMIVNDVTARDRVKRSDPGAIGPDWIGAKGGPGFLPTGPWFVPAAFIPEPHRLAMRLRVNGVLMQDDTSADMTFDIPAQIEQLTTYARLVPGDILCTGSPAGNGVARGIFLKDGDVMEAEIAGLGVQRTRCVRSPAA